MSRRMRIAFATLALSGPTGCLPDDAGERPPSGGVEVLWSFPPDRTSGCDGTPDVATVRATVTGNMREYSRAIDCGEGQSILIPGVGEGIYALRVDAFTSDDIRFYAAELTDIQVEEGSTSPVEVTLTAVPGTIRLEWWLPTNCDGDGVRDILVQVFDGDATVYDNTETLDACDDRVVFFEGNWILSREDHDYGISVNGLNDLGVSTHDWAECDLALESGIVNAVIAELFPCAGGLCCPSGLCQNPCP